MCDVSKRGGGGSLEKRTYDVSQLSRGPVIDMRGFPYKIMGQNFNVLIACDERRQSLHTNQLVSIVIIIINYWTRSSKIS